MNAQTQSHQVDIHSALRAALAAKGFKLETPVHLKEKSLAKEVVTAPRGKGFLIIAEIDPSDVYGKDGKVKNGLQVVAGLPAGKGAPSQSLFSTNMQFKALKVDLNSALSRFSVQGMNVTDTGGHVKFFIKFEEVGNHKGELGFDTWKDGPYADLAKEVMKRTFKSGTFKVGDDRSSLMLKKLSAAGGHVDATTRVFFKIEETPAA